MQFRQFLHIRRELILHNVSARSSARFVVSLSLHEPDAPWGVRLITSRLRPRT